VIRWADIEAECGDFRAGFIAVFRKYEGEETDEREGGRVVTVSQRSFARHMGISDRTFNDWLKKDEGLKPGAGRDRVAEGIRRDPVAAAPAIAEAMSDPEVRKHVQRSMSDTQIDAVAESGHEVVVERLRAKRDEEDLPTSPSVSDLLPDQEDVDQGPYGLLTATWLDGPLTTARSRMQMIETGMRKHGTVFGSMGTEQALEYAEYIEKIAAELRVALQERLRDEQLSQHQQQA